MWERLRLMMVVRKPEMDATRTMEGKWVKQEDLLALLIVSCMVKRSDLF